MTPTGDFSAAMSGLNITPISESTSGADASATLTDDVSSTFTLAAKMIRRHLLHLMGNQEDATRWYDYLILRDLEDFNILLRDRHILSRLIENPFVFNGNQYQLHPTTQSRYRHLFAHLFELSIENELSTPLILRILLTDVLNANVNRLFHPYAISPTNQNQNADNSTTTTVVATKTERSFADLIKKDISAFNVFKKDSGWLAWRPHFINLAGLQQFWDVLDPDEPVDISHDDYDAKCAYAWTVFNTTLKSPRTTKFPLKHAGSQDVRALWSELEEEFSNMNPHSDYNVTDLQRWLLTTTLDETWKRPLAEYFIEFEVNISKLELLKHSIVPDEQKLTYIKTATQPHSELFNTWNRDEQQDRRFGRTPDFQSTYNSLRSMAINLDRQVTVKQRLRTA